MTLQPFLARMTPPLLIRHPSGKFAIQSWQAHCSAYSLIYRVRKNTNSVQFTHTNSGSMKPPLLATSGRQF